MLQDHMVQEASKEVREWLDRTASKDQEEKEDERVTLDQREQLDFREKMEKRVTLDIWEIAAQRANMGKWDLLDLREFQVLQARWEQLALQENQGNEVFRVSTEVRELRDREVCRDQSVRLESRVCPEQSAPRVKLVTLAKRVLLDQLDLQDLQERLASRAHLDCQDL